jgi:cell wall-associated NlpC family hydrolase
MWRSPKRAVVVLSLAGAIIASSSAALAVPPIPGPPNTGSRPVPNGQLPLPSAGEKFKPATSNLPKVTTDPLLLKLAQEEAAVEAISERLNDVSEEIGQLAVAHAKTVAELDRARTALASRQAEADQWAHRTYIGAAANPSVLPLDPARGEKPTVVGVFPPSGLATPLAKLASAQREFADAERLEAEAARAQAAQQKLLTDLGAQLVAKGAALGALRAQNAAAIAAAEAKRDAEYAKLSALYLKDAVGKAAPEALKAVEYALKQLGKDYVWGAEGPNEFDCSGLVQAAYASAGKTLPRTARPQFRATPKAPLNALLPGDLLFFATNRSDWNTIHHVAIYLGKGKMIHAPKANDVVRIAPIWWAEFFGATRVVPAPPQPKPKPPTKPNPKPAPSPSPSPSPSPGPTKPPGTTPTPTPTPSCPSSAATPSASGSTPPPNGTGSASPTPTPTPSCPP